MIYRDHDQKTLEQFKSVMKNAEKGALLADGHIGYVMPIGGVTASSNRCLIRISAENDFITLFVEQTPL